MADVEPIQSEDEKPPRDEAALARMWCAEIAAAEKQHAKWIERGKKIEKIYCDDRDGRNDRSRKFNILWANVETLRPAVYMQTPKARAVRRYQDKDPVARFTSVLIERGTQTSCELYDFDHAMDQAVRDRLLVGRGTTWVFYSPKEIGQGDQAALAYEDVQAEYVPWTDFLHSVARTWERVWWVGRWFHLSRRELIAWLEARGLDRSKAFSVAMDTTDGGKEKDDELKDERARARICEIWNKRDGEVIYVAPGSGDSAILGHVDPPVRFRDFFPCPRPMLATTTSKSLIPTPDYAMYQDQAEELNKVTERIGVLQKALKVAGVYASESEELAQMLETSENRMIPVKNWAMFAEAGGVKNRIEWFPVEQVSAVLERLYMIREQAKQTLYEVSGIGDILRGATDPNETLGAQKIKEQWGSKRVRRLQKDVQRFAAETIRLKAEVLSEQFQFTSVLAMAGVDRHMLGQYVPMPAGQPSPQVPPELAQNPQAMAQVQALAKQQQEMAHAQAVKAFLGQVEQLLRDDTARNFRISVETDSTLEPDLQTEKQTAVEFATAIGTFMREAQSLMAQGPEVAKLIGEVLLFVVRRFGNDTEQLEKTVEEAIEAASKPRETTPDPEMMKAQATVEKTKADIEVARADLAIRKQSARLDAEKLLLENRKLTVKERLETSKLEDGRDARERDFEHRDKDRQLSEYTVRRKDAGDDEVEDMDAERDGKPSRTEQLIAAMSQSNTALMGAIVAELRRPKRVVRGPDGRAEGVE